MKRNLTGFSSHGGKNVEKERRERDLKDDKRTKELNGGSEGKIEVI